jgi:hypothetical protein
MNRRALVKRLAEPGLDTRIGEKMGRRRVS